MATAKKKAPAADQAAEPTFTKEQLVKSKTLNPVSYTHLTLPTN